jgi:hypothetical protein
VTRFYGLLFHVFRDGLAAVDDFVIQVDPLLFGQLPLGSALKLQLLLFFARYFFAALLE